jgi:glutamate racemase
MCNRDDSILIFDSGLGGLSVLRQLRLQLPGERFVYYGDTAYAPYGVRSAQEVRELTLRAVEQQLPRGIKAIVIACNTATAAAIDALRLKYPQRIIVGMEPALKLGADRFPGGRIGVLATPLTLREEKLSRLAAKLQNVQMVSIPLPGLVERIEAGASDRELEDFLRPELQPYAGQLDAAVLGCTHYPFAASAIRNILGEQVTLLDGAEGTARQTHRLLREAGLLREGTGSLTLECSGDYEKFLSRCQELLEKA